MWKTMYKKCTPTNSNKNFTNHSSAITLIIFTLSIGQVGCKNVDIFVPRTVCINGVLGPAGSQYSIIHISKYQISCWAVICKIRHMLPRGLESLEYTYKYGRSESNLLCLQHWEGVCLYVHYSFWNDIQVYYRISILQLSIKVFVMRNGIQVCYGVSICTKVFLMHNDI